MKLIKFKNCTSEVELNIEMIISIIKRDNGTYEIMTPCDRSLYINQKEYNRLKKYIREVTQDGNECERDSGA